MKYLLILAIIGLVGLSACTSAGTQSITGSATGNENQNVPTTSMDEFAQCLTDNDAIMYGAHWCSYCNSQKQMFGNAEQFINYVECEDEKARCIAAGVQGYPTWIIQGEAYVGRQSLEQLGQATGCNVPA